jgi:hypothetical protein
LVPDVIELVAHVVEFTPSMIELTGEVGILKYLVSLLNKENTRMTYLLEHEDKIRVCPDCDHR